jgi:hypothetical protein
MSEEKEPLSESAYQSGMRQFSKAIEDAQTRCDSRTADDIYQKQMKWMDQVRPESESGIVDGKSRTF